MKSKLSKILGVALTLTILVSLLVTTVATPAMAGDRKWTKSNLPVAGANGDWFRHIDMDEIGPMAKTIDDMLIIGADIGGTPYLFKSDDWGRTWSRIKKYSNLAGVDYAIDFATDPEDGDTFYVLDDSNNVWRTTDMGSNFVSITGLGLGATNLSSIDFDWVGGNAYLFAGGDDDVYRFDEYEYGATWQSLGLNAAVAGTPNVLDIRTSPNFSNETNPMVMALYENGISTYISYKYGSADWGDVVGNVELDDNGGGIANDGRFSETFPADFDSDNSTGLLEYWVATSGPDAVDGVWRIVGNQSFEKIGNTDDFNCVDFAGNVANGTILAGTTFGEIYRANDGVGGTWAKTQCVPNTNAAPATGDVWLLMGPDYLEDDFAVAAFNDPSVFAYQVRDRQWVGQSLIEAEIDVINDVAFGSTRFQMTTDTGNYSNIWRKSDDGTWDLVRWLDNAFSVANEYGLLVSDEFETDETVFYWDNNASKFFRSTNAGDRFIGQLNTYVSNVSAAHAFSSSSLLISTTGNGTYKTGNNGTTWGNNAADPDDGVDFAVDPTDDQHVLCGDDSGAVFESTNQGKTWAELTKGNPFATTDDVYVAFDPVEAETFYAASSAGTDLDINRWGDDGWVSIYVDTALTGNTGDATGIVAAESGCGTALYVTEDNRAGVLRSLNPRAAKAANVFWELANAGGPDLLMDLNEVEGSIELYAISNGGTHVWTFNDTLAYPVEGVSVVGDAATATARVSWSAMDGADQYQVDIADRDDFKTGLIATATPGGTSTTFATLLPGTDYWVRVRVNTDEPLRSCWSDTAQFQTGMGPAAWNPFVVSGLTAPAAGAKDIDPVQPLFQWNPADDAASYEFQLADNAAFAGADTKVVKSPAYEWPGDLEYGKTYYWRVRSIKANGATSEWAMGIFTTADEPVPETPPVVVAPPQPTAPPQYIPTTYIPEYILWTIVGIGGLLIIALIILIMKTRRVA